MNFRSLLQSSVLAVLTCAVAASAASATLLQQDFAAADTTEKKDKKEKKNLPLEAGRTVSISTDEGTWVSVDVSPDGQTIVLDFLGDLYTIPFSGGDAAPLTSGMAFDAQPRFSPDGKKVLFVSDRSGNEILKGALEQADGEGIDATIYTHPLGFHGHGAGPTIGLWDRQGGVPGRGDATLHPSTVYSIELNAAVDIADWGGKEILIMLEEDALFDGQKVRYLDGRQTTPHLIP